jgi:DNA-binding YbaB/EbfC family protein
MFNNLSNLADLMKNAGKIRENVEKATEALGHVVVEGSAGGVVTVKANGRLEVISIQIAPKVLDEADVELLEDLVTAAVNQALSKAREAAAHSMASLAGGMPIPGLSGLLGPGAGGS